MSVLTATLERIVAASGSSCNAWWIIGSAAVVLHGVETSVADVDVLCADEAEARMLVAALGGKLREGTGTALFRSSVFGRCEGTALPVEVMAGFTVRGKPVRLVTRERVRCGEVLVPVPSRVELVALLRRFGRGKDLARAALLER